MESIFSLGIPYLAISLPVLIIFVIFYFDNKSKKEKYDTIIEISKSLKDPSDIKELLEDFKERKNNRLITEEVGCSLYLLVLAYFF